jgi:hypothetical protein
MYFEFTKKLESTHGIFENNGKKIYRKNKFESLIFSGPSKI